MNENHVRHAAESSGPPRERILDRAIELLALHGFEAMTMRELGDAVGLDNSSLYRHFKSKSEIAHAALDHVVGEFLDAFQAQMDLSRPVTLEALEELAAAAGLFFFDRQAPARLMMHWIMSTGATASGFGVSVSATDISRPGGKLMKKLGAWLAEGVHGGALRKHAMPEAMVILFAAILLRPATYGHLLASVEPRRSLNAARKAWETELRAVVRGAFAP